MSRFAGWDTQTLLDLLVSRTSELVKMRTSGTHTVEEIAQCRDELVEIQGELKANLDHLSYDPEDKTETNEEMTKTTETRAS